MALIEMLTREDLIEFRKELLTELHEAIKKNNIPGKKWLKTDEVRTLLGVSAGKQKL